MQINITYPPKKRARKFWKMCCFIFNICFVIAIISLPIINIWAGGKPWCVIALFGTYIIWSLLISPSLYELNRTYLSIKTFMDILLLLLGINLLLTDGNWGLFVIPIVSFAGLTICTILFFSDFNRQKHNAVPFVFITILCFVAGMIGMFNDLVTEKWVFVVLASLSLVTFVICTIFLRKSFFKDLKKQLNTK